MPRSSSTRRRPSEIAGAVTRLLGDRGARRDLTERGRARAAEFTLAADGGGDARVIRACESGGVSFAARAVRRLASAAARSTA